MIRVMRKMSKWFEVQRSVTENLVYVGPGSDIFGSWIFTGVLIIGTLYMVYWGMSRGAFPRP